MATLHWATASDQIRGTGHGAMSGAMTIAALIRHTVTNADIVFYSRTSGGGNGVMLGLESSHKQRVFHPDYGWSVGPDTINVNDWWIVAVTRTAGSATPRFHQKNITTGGAWAHGNATVPFSTNHPSISGGYVQLGRYADGGIQYTGQIAVAAFWDGTALTDGQTETLDDTSKTSDWNALSPSSLTQLTSLTPTDLKGLVTWTRTGPLLTGPDPTGWTFDGLGGGPPANTVAPAVTGTAVSGQILICSTGTWTNTPTGYTYQWKRGGSAISGATSSTYTLVSADKSTSVKCTVTATNATASVAADSNAVSVSTLDALPDTGDVLIRTSTGWITLT